MLSDPPRPGAPDGYDGHGTAVVPPADLTAEIVAVLADLLPLTSETIDPGQTFRVLGLDSMLAVEFVADVNRRCGTVLRVAALADHPTPVALARHAASTLRARVPSAPAPAARGERRPAALELGVRHVLKEELAALLACSPHDIDEHAPFRVLGVDSILGAEFLAAVNRVYGTAERGPVLQDHPTVAALASRLARTLSPRALDLGAVLDSVRDGRLGVDEAVTLLSRHA